MKYKAGFNLLLLVCLLLHSGMQTVLAKSNDSKEFALLKARVIERGSSDRTSCNLLSTFGLLGKTDVKRVESMSPENVKHVFNVLEDPAAKSSSILVRYGADHTDCFLVSGTGELQKAVRTKGTEHTILDSEVATSLFEQEYQFWRTELDHSSTSSEQRPLSIKSGRNR